MKNIALFLFFFLIFLPVNVFSINDSTFIHDESNFLKNETYQYLEESSHFLKDTLDIEYYLFTIPSLDNMPIEYYANNLCYEYDISNQSIIIVYSKFEKQIHIRVGSDLSTLINNKTIDKHIKSYFLPFLKYEEYDQGLKNGYNSFYKLICDAYQLDSDKIDVYDSLDFKFRYKGIILLLIYWICSLFAYIFCSFFKSRISSKKVSFIMIFIFICILIINIWLFNVAYIIEKRNLYVLLFLELISIFSALYKSSKKVNIKNKIRN